MHSQWKKQCSDSYLAGPCDPVSAVTSSHIRAPVPHISDKWQSGKMYTVKRDVMLYGGGLSYPRGNDRCIWQLVPDWLIIEQHKRFHVMNNNSMYKTKMELGMAPLPSVSESLFMFSMYNVLFLAWSMASCTIAFPPVNNSLYVCSVMYIVSLGLATLLFVQIVMTQIKQNAFYTSVHHIHHFIYTLIVTGLPLTIGLIVRLT